MVCESFGCFVPVLFHKHTAILYLCIETVGSVSHGVIFIIPEAGGKMESNIDLLEE